MIEIIILYLYGLGDISSLNSFTKFGQKIFIFEPSLLYSLLSKLILVY